MFEKQTLSIRGNCRLLPAAKSPSGYFVVRSRPLRGVSGGPQAWSQRDFLAPCAFILEWPQSWRGVRSETAWLTVMACSTRKSPLLLRCRESRCAPLPRASPRSRANALTYVPLLHAMRIVARGRPRDELSVTFMRADALDSSSVCGSAFFGRFSGAVSALPSTS